MDTILEVIAIISGLASVWLSRRESVFTYPVGLLNTSFYTYLSFKYHLPGESAVNFYYTIMSLYGWYMWALKNDQHEKVLHITFSNKKMWVTQVLFFVVIYLVVFAAIISLKSLFWEGAIPAADAFATATAFTAMWLMTRKKVESWYWWIATNFASIPLYYVKGLELTAGYYLVLLVFAFWGLATWKKKAHAA